jgi:UDP-glucose 4-epimerase
MTYLLTGSKGFLGRHVRKELERIQPLAEICQISSVNSKETPTIIRTGSELLISEQSLEILKNVTHLIHIGSFMPKRKEEANRFDLASESISFTKNLLLLPMPNLEKIVYMSTVDVYSRKVTPISEMSDTLLTNAYTSMKLFCEKMVEEFCVRRDVHLDILRSGHLYGEGDEVFEKLIPNLFRAVFNDYQFKLEIGFEQELNLLYVKDAAKIICEVALKDSDGGVANLVSSEPVTLGRLLEIVELVSGKKLKVEKLGNHVDNSQYNFQISRLQGKLDYVETPLEIGLLEVSKLWASRQK